MDNYRCGQVFLIVASIGVFFVGGVLSGCGFFLKLESGYLSTDAIALLNKIEFSGLKLGLLGEGLAYMLMVFGAITVIVALSGICCAWKRHRYCLVAYVVILICIMIIQGFVVGMWLTFRGRTDQWLKGQMITLLKDYTGPTETDVVTKGWNAIFIDAHCCGVNDQFKNGGTNSDFTELPTTWTSGTDKVPATCCQGVTKDTVSTYENSPSCTNTPTNFYTTGCYEDLRSLANMYALIIGITCACALIIQVTAIVCACIVMDSAKNRVSQVSSSKPPPYISVDNTNRSKFSEVVQAVQRNRRNELN